MNRRLNALVLIGLLAAPALAQDQPTVEQLQKQLDEAREQLKAAQERKSELNTEIQKLQKKLTDAEQSAADSRQKVESLENRSYFVDERSATWDRFLDRYPRIKELWTRFLASESTGEAPGNDLSELLGDGNWPFSVKG